MLSYAFGVSLFLVSLRALVTSPSAGGSAKVYTHIAMTQHLEQFARGVMDSPALVYHLSLIVFFLFLTCKVVESRRWK